MPSDYETLRFRAADGLATITLDRPEAMNAISGRMAAELGDALTRVEGDDSVRVVNVTGQGRAFCCGADLKGVLHESLSGVPSALTDFVERIQHVIQQLRALEKPTIAAVNGLALAGGLELLLACDVIVAAEGARLGDAHSNFGVLPGAGGGTLLPRAIGEKKASLLLYSGDHWPAAEFERVGLVSMVVPDADLITTVAELAKKFADKSPLVLRRMKQMVSQCRSLSVEDALRLELDLMRVHASSADLLEGLHAFSEKRTPVYRGM